MSDEPAWPPEPLHVAVDVTVFSVVDDRLHVLLIRRPYEPFEGRWALPGTFSRPDETLEESPRRALRDKAGLEGVYLEQLATYDQPPHGEAPGRDPRGRVVSVAFLALIGAGRVGAGEQVRWWDVAELPTPLAFDHERILRDGVERLRAKTRYAPVAFQLLPDEFTLTELQGVYEAVMGESLDVRNFRRDLKAAGVIEPTGDTVTEGPGRPAKLYRHVPGSFAVDAEERRVAERIARSREGDAGDHGGAGHDGGEGGG
ncbi:MAG: NUDIX domain-containing protein [Nitriliruptorales bacterium]|nr:NUDIX domain-containing protein [Nitriliruptorales bacterium]